MHLFILHGPVDLAEAAELDAILVSCGVGVKCRW